MIFRKGGGGGVGQKIYIVFDDKNDMKDSP